MYDLRILVILDILDTDNLFLRLFTASIISSLCNFLHSSITKAWSPLASSVFHSLSGIHYPHYIPIYIYPSLCIPLDNCPNNKWNSAYIIIMFMSKFR